MEIAQTVVEMVQIKKNQCNPSKLWTKPIMNFEKYG